MGRLRLIDGGKPRAQGDQAAVPGAASAVPDAASAVPPDEFQDEAATVVAASEFPARGDTAADPADDADRIFDDAAVDDALGALGSAEDRGSARGTPGQVAAASPPRSSPLSRYTPRPGFTLPSADFVPESELSPPIVPVAPAPRIYAAAAPALPARRGLKPGVLVVGGAAVLAGGLALGWAVFARGNHAAREATSETSRPAAIQMPVTQPTRSPATAPGSAGQVAAQAAKTDDPPKRAAATAEITSLEHPVFEQVVAPSHGQVAQVAAATPRNVKPGETLFTIRHKQSGGARAAALVKRIAELQALAKDDPAAYEPFLARARRDLEQLQGVAVVPVKASAAGLFASRVKVGDEVKDGDALGALVDGRTWVAVATVQGAAPNATWSCAVATPDDTHSAACKIQTTEAVEGGGGTRVTVEISASVTAWLDGLNLHPRLVLEPPTAR